MNNKFEDKISNSQANEFGVNLLEFFRLIYKPIPISVKIQNDKTTN